MREANNTVKNTSLNFPYNMNPSVYLPPRPNLSVLPSLHRNGLNILNFLSDSRASFAVFLLRNLHKAKLAQREKVLSHKSIAGFSCKTVSTSISVSLCVCLSIFLSV